MRRVCNQGVKYQARRERVRYKIDQRIKLVTVCVNVGAKNARARCFQRFGHAAVTGCYLSDKLPLDMNETRLVF
jgi:hypothetical protein